MSQTTPKNNANPDVGRTKRTPVTLAIAAMGIVVVGALAWILTDDNNELAEYIKVSEKTVSVPRNPQHDADDAREGATQDVSRILNQEESDAPIQDVSRILNEEESDAPISPLTRASRHKLLQQVRFQPVTENPNPKHKSNSR